MLKKLLSCPDVIVLAEDEAIIYRATSISRMWAVEGSQPQILSDSTHEKVGLFGAVNLVSGRLYYQGAEKFNALTFENFLNTSLVPNLPIDKKIFMILDNARWHHAKVLQPFLDKIKDRFELLFLPAYSPDLNPMERVWKFVRRRVTHNTYFGSLKELRETLFPFLNKFDRENDTLYSLCAVN